MRFFATTLFFFLVLPGVTLAGAYQRTDGSVVDPFLNTPLAAGGPHPYSGPDLEPFVALSGITIAFAILSEADLEGADLSGSTLSNNWFDEANFTDADLIGADLTGSDMTNAVVAGANFSGANLRNISTWGSTSGSALYDSSTNFAFTGFDPVAAGWTFVPEPGTALLVGFGLAGLAVRRW